MEWVETTAKTVDEAKEAALDQLGVLEEDAEFEILEEPKPGLFGRVRGNARVKARVAPSAPPPKQERRRRNGRGVESSKASTSGGGSKGQKAETDVASGGSAEESVARDSAPDASTSGGKAQRSTENGGPGARDGGSKARKEREMMPESEQREAGEDFLRGLLTAIGYDAAVSSSLDEEGLLSFEVDGEQLGLLIGPGLNTLDSVQEVCRNAIQRQADGREYGKVTLDVSGARRDRTESLEAFVRQEAERVLDSGDDVIFDVMSRGDRKIVHDVVGEFDDLATESVGEDPRRRVVLGPA